MDQINLSDRGTFLSSILVNEPKKPTKKKFCWGILSLVFIVALVIVIIFVTRKEEILNPMV